MQSFKERFQKRIVYLTREKRPLKKRLLLSLLVNVFFAFTLIFYTPAEAYLNNIGEFGFTFGTLCAVMGVGAFLIAAALTGISLIFKGRLFDYFTTAVFAFTLCSYLQGAFFNGSLPPLDGAAVQWHLMTGEALWNLFLWIFLFVLVFAVRFFDRRTWQKILSLVSAAAIAVHAMLFAVTAMTADLSAFSVDGYLSRDDLYEVSDEGGVLVLIIDYFDNEYVDNLLEEDEDLFEEFTGFTRFADCTGLYKQTMSAIPFLMTGYQWKNEVDAYYALTKGFSDSAFMERVADTGAEVDLYTADLTMSEEMFSYATNYYEATPQVNPIKLFANMINYSLYRNMPLITKSVFWHYTSDISNNSIRSDALDEKSPYTCNDPLFYADLAEGGIKAKSADESFYKFIHLNGAHPPYTMDETGKAGSGLTETDQQKGTIHVVSEYLRGLKEQGVYDSTTIIVMADHGIVEVDTNRLSRAVLPACFVKPAGAQNVEMTTSYAPVSQTELHATVLWGLGDEAYSDFGRTFFEVPEDEVRERYFYWRVTYNSGEGEDVGRLLEYKITGDGRDFANWTYTGNHW